MSTCPYCKEREANMTKLGICSTCYHFLNYWRKRTVGDKVRHTQKLDVWAARAHRVLLREANVVPIRSRRKTG